MGIFSDMDFLGLGKFKDTNIIEDSKSKKATTEVDKKEIKLNESDYLFDKRYECPICDNSFLVKAVKANKLKIVSKDTDLRTVYEGVDPVKYEVITCGLCGYSSLIRYYGKLSSTQMKRLREDVKCTFRGIDTNTQLVSYDDAIIKYKLALICSKVKMCKMSERAYTFLKLSWAYRGKRNNITSKAITEEFPKDVKHALIERYDYDGKPKPISFGLKSMDFATLSNAGWAFYPPNNPPVEGTNNFKKYSLTQGKILTGHTVPTSALKGQVFLKWK